MKTQDNNMEITILGKKKNIVEINDGTILDAIKLTDETFVSPCGGRKLCQNCKVSLTFDGKTTTVLACSTKLQDGMVVVLPNESIDSDDRKIGIDKANCCLDIGTTTLVFSILDLNNNVIKEYSMINPQMVFGNDVMTRIQYASENGVSNLSSILLNSIRAFLSKHAETSFQCLFVSGNTTMLHLLLNEDVSSLGQYPFIPKFLDKKIIEGKDLDLPVDKVFVLPSISAFVGGDITSGIYFSNLLDGNNLLVDVGTNGEMALSFNNKLFVTSTAAGPAFEGSCIECGTNAIGGAINKVIDDNNKLTYETIGGKSPIGITGSGLVDLISILKSQNTIDESGLLLTENKKYYLCENVYISQKDIRNFQYAKSAIYTGIKLLIREAHISIDQINNVYIAGSLGEHLNIDSCLNVSLLPKELKDKYVVIGNSSLKGLIKYCKNSKVEEFDFINNCKNISLNDLNDFMDEFVENLML